MNFLWIFFCLIGSTLSASELKLVHVIFSHKLYAPLEIDGNKVTFPDKLDYKYFLENTDDMVNSAKLDMYNLGVSLRDRYNNFLGDIYYPDIMQMRTTEYILSMISGLLVDAGLWPPADAQKWHENLNWQPIPTDYVPAEHDSLLLGNLCPRFIHETEKVYEGISSEKHKPLYDYISKNLKVKIDQPVEIEMLYSYFQTLVDKNVSLPNWAKEIFPDGEFMNVALLSYNLLSTTTVQKQLSGGTLLKKIIDNSLAHKNSNGTSKLKISMFSAEERNIVSVLQCLNRWKPHILSQATALLFEIYGDTLSEQYFVKMFYYGDQELQSFNLAGCGDLCPFEAFSALLEPVLPADEKSLCASSASILKLYTSKWNILLMMVTIFICSFHKSLL